jgi:hypothetical protein
LSDAGKLARTYNGRAYDSLAEMRFAQQLDQRLRARDIADWTAQVPVLAVVNGVNICKLVFDFEVIRVDATREMIDVKGFSTAEFKLKLKLVKALYPSMLVTIVPAKDVR